MNKFSIIIPTMWRYEPFIKFLEDLCTFDQIDEILIINNDAKKLEERGWLTGRSVLYSRKIRLLGDGTNIGCNGGWNLGAKEAKNEFLCFANDDIIFPLQTFFRIQDHLSNEKPLIGMSAGDPIWKQPPHDIGSIKVTEWIRGESTHGFGCLFFVLKSWWIPIPSDLFLYFGDNWVADTVLIRNKPLYLLTDFPYVTPFAVTSSEIGTNEMLVREHRIYQERLKEWNLTR